MFFKHMVLASFNQWLSQFACMDYTFRTAYTFFYSFLWKYLGLIKLFDNTNVKYVFLNKLVLLTTKS